MNTVPCINKDRLFIIFLIVSCLVFGGFSEDTLSAAEPNELAGTAPFIKFANEIRKNENCSKALREFCNTADIGVIHTFSYYKTIGQVQKVEESQQSPEIAKARKLLWCL